MPHAGSGLVGATVTRARIVVAHPDDSFVLRLTGHLYRRLEGVDILPTATGAGARQLLEQDRPAVVATQVRPGDPDGVAVLRWAAAASWRPRIIAVMPDGPGRREHLVYAMGAAAICSPDASLQHLGAQVERALGAEQDFAGRLETVHAADLVQTLCMSNANQLVRLRAGDGQGAIWIVDGQVFHAVWNDRGGPDALPAIVQANAGRFWGHAPLPGFPRTLEGNWQHALLDAVRLADERDETSHQTDAGTADAANADSGDADTPSSATVHAAERSGEYKRLTDLGLAAMRAGDLSKAREHWEAARKQGEAEEAAADTTTVKSSA